MRVGRFYGPPPPPMRQDATPAWLRRFFPEQMEDNVPAVPMTTRLPRIGAICRLLALIMGLALPLAACSHGRIGEDFCISCAGENHAEAGAPPPRAAGAPRM